LNASLYDTVSFIFFLLAVPTLSQDATDSLRFNAFKAELDAGGEYNPVAIWTEKNRDWDRDKTFARWVVTPADFELWLYKKDNSLVRYTYLPKPAAGAPKSITNRF
jgi:hypothetical protein